MSEQKPDDCGTCGGTGELIQQWQECCQQPTSSGECCGDGIYCEDRAECYECKGGLK